MAEVIFYEKPGCSGNARQKALLEAAGHKVVARDLLTEPWTRLALLAFFQGLPVAQWFNRSAPAIKSGEIVPEELNEIAALELLQARPQLIRRPLMEVGGERRVGFDAAAVDAWIGLASLPDGDVESCQHGAGGNACAAHESDVDRHH